MAPRSPAPAGTVTRPRPTTRTDALLIRLTPEERAALAPAAKRAGLGLGPWLRMLGLREASR